MSKPHLTLLNHLNENNTFKCRCASCFHCVEKWPRKRSENDTHNTTPSAPTSLVSDLYHRTSPNRDAAETDDPRRQRVRASGKILRKPACWPATIFKHFTAVLQPDGHRLGGWWLVV